MTPRDKILLSDAAAVVKQFVPETTIYPKELSRLHRFIAFILFFNKSYLNRYWTTIGYEMAYPSNPVWHVVFHEGVHVRQAEKYTRIGFGFLYLFPQTLAALVVLAPILSWWWLLALLFLAPLPAPFRMLFELEAYQMSVSIHQWRNGSTSKMKRYIDQIVSNFTGPGYWFMWPWKSYIRRKLEEAQDKAFFLRYNISDPYEIAVLQFLIDTGELEEQGTITGNKGIE